VSRSEFEKEPEEIKKQIQNEMKIFFKEQGTFEKLVNLFDKEFQTS